MIGAMTSSREPEPQLSSNGRRLLLIGTAMLVVGVALAAALDDKASGIGLAVAGLGAVPFFAGLGMWLSAVVSRRAGSGKPFA
jgi:hypothetical protein